MQNYRTAHVSYTRMLKDLIWNYASLVTIFRKRMLNDSTLYVETDYKKII